MHDPSWIHATSESYDRVAEPYADLVAEGLQGLRLETRLVDYFVSEIQRSGGGPVLDVGCGPGVLTRDLATRGLDVVGSDVSTAMLRAARTAAPHIAVMAASITRLPLRAASVAGAFCWYVMHHVPDEDLLGSVQEVARVMRPGGLLMVGGHIGEGSYIKTAGYGGTPMKAWFVRRSARLYADLLRQSGLQVEATMEIGSEDPAAGAVWFARKLEE